MSIQFEQRQKEDVIIVTVHGELVAGPKLQQLRHKLENELAEGKNKFVLDLADVDYIDSTALGILVICFTKLRRSGGDLKLLHLNKRNIELLVLTKLATVFEVFTDEQDAVNSFYPGRKIHRFDILSFVEKKQTEGTS